MFEALSVAKIAKAIGIKGFISIGLALALALVMWRADSISKDREDMRNKLAAERAAHAVTRASVDNLQNSLATYVGAGKAAKVAQLAAIDAQAKDNAQLKAQADAIRAEMAAPKAKAADCKTPGSILKAKGL